jgi:hypothetical protein
VRFADLHHLGSKPHRDSAADDNLEHAPHSVQRDVSTRPRLPMGQPASRAAAATLRKSCRERLWECRFLRKFFLRVMSSSVWVGLSAQL